VRASRERGTPTTEREGPTCSIRGVSWTIGRLRKKRRHGSRNCEEVAPPSLYRIRFSLFWLVTSMHNAPTQAARGSMGKASCCPPPHLTLAIDPLQVPREITSSVSVTLDAKPTICSLSQGLSTLQREQKVQLY
jgi:hypothetical protein